MPEADIAETKREGVSERERERERERDRPSFGRSTASEARRRHKTHSTMTPTWIT